MEEDTDKWTNGPIVKSGGVGVGLPEFSSWNFLVESRLLAVQIFALEMHVG